MNFSYSAMNSLLNMYKNDLSMLYNVTPVTIWLSSSHRKWKTLPPISMRGHCFCARARARVPFFGRILWFYMFILLQQFLCIWALFILDVPLHIEFSWWNSCPRPFHYEFVTLLLGHFRGAYYMHFLTWSEWQICGLEKEFIVVCFTL